HHPDLHSCPTRRSSDLQAPAIEDSDIQCSIGDVSAFSLIRLEQHAMIVRADSQANGCLPTFVATADKPQLLQMRNFRTLFQAFRSEEHTSELQSRENLV